MARASLARRKAFTVIARNAATKQSSASWACWMEIASSPRSSQWVVTGIPACDSGDAINRLGVLQEDAALLHLGHLDRQRVGRIVEIPMRIVGGEQHAVPAHPFDRVCQMLARFRLFHR